MSDVIESLLRRLPLPAIDEDDSKEERGHALVIGGGTRVPGAVLLAGVGALRAGAGKLQLATVRDAAIPLALAVPESLVLALPQTRAGEIDGGRAVRALRSHLDHARAVLVGPGMLSDGDAGSLVKALVPRLSRNAVLVLDGAAAVALARLECVLHPLDGRAILTPHAGEMASLLRMDKARVEADPAAAAQHAARHLLATVALKGPETWIAEPDGSLYRYRGGAVGLGTSGSGDTLAGIVAGLAARGASPLCALLWGVWAHGTAGERLTTRVARVGFLAREILDEIPALVGNDDGPPTR